MAIYVCPAERARLALAEQNLRRVQGKISYLEHIKRKLLVEIDQSPNKKREMEKEIEKLEKIKFPGLIRLLDLLSKCGAM